MKTLKIVITVIAVVLVGALTWWCINLFREENTVGKTDFGIEEVQTANLTCVVAGNDSTTLLLGSKNARFSAYDVATGNTQDFPLPDYTANSATYDILPVGADSYLVAKRNSGVLMVTYGIGDNSRRVIKNVTRIAAPPAPVPDKHTHYSAYSLIDVDSTIIIGSSNGLLYIDKANLAAAAGDSLVHAAFAPQLLHLAQGKKQFAQESTFVIGDSLTTVTDHGIYRMATADMRPGATRYHTIDDEMRCYDAKIIGDSMAVLWSPDDQSDSRRVTMFALNGRRGSTRSVPTSVKWLGNYGDSLRLFSNEGDFGCFRAATSLGGNFYFIHEGELCKSNPASQHVAGDEHVMMADNGYALSNTMGIWDLTGERPEFLGEVTGVSGVRDISVSNGTMYLAVSDGIYSVSLAKRLLAYNRKASLVERNLNKSSDRFESVFAAGDTLLVGTRNGLHAYIQSDGTTRQYDLQHLRQMMESPYISKIVRDDDGAYLLKTLNHGIWRLNSLNDQEALPANKPLIDKSEATQYLPGRPTLTWRKISENAVVIIIVILALLGLLAVGIFAVKMRANSKLSSLSRQIANERKKYQEQTASLEQAHQSLKQRTEDMQRLEAEYQNALHASDSQMAISFDAISTKIEQCVAQLGNDDIYARYLTSQLADIRQHTSADDSSHLHEAAEIYRRIHDLCEYTIDHAYRLADVKDVSGIWSQPLDEYRQKIITIAKPKDQSLDSRLNWLVEFAPVRNTLFNSIVATINQLVDDAYNEDGKYSSSVIFNLWNSLILPAKVADGRLTIARGQLDADTELFVKTRTEMLTTITCFGCTAPYVDGKPIADDALQMIRFENTSQIGTVYKFWAMQLSKDIFEFGEVGMAATIADLMWHTFIVGQTDSLGTITSTSGKQTPVTLAMGVRLAYCRSHKLPIPDDIAALLSSRQKGRPRKSIKPE